MLFRILTQFKQDLPQICQSFAAFYQSWQHIYQFTWGYSLLIPTWQYLCCATIKHCQGRLISKSQGRCFRSGFSLSLKPLINRLFFLPLWTQDFCSNSHNEALTDSKSISYRLCAFLHFWFIFHKSPAQFCRNQPSCRSISQPPPANSSLRRAFLHSII